MQMNIKQWKSFKRESLAAYLRESILNFDLLTSQWLANCKDIHEVRNKVSTAFYCSHLSVCINAKFAIW